MIVEMDRESNWDICPVCREHLWNLATFPGVDAMRAHHQAHNWEQVRFPKGVSE